MDGLSALKSLLGQSSPVKKPGRPQKMPKKKNPRSNDILSRLKNSGKVVPQNPPTSLPGESY